MNPYLLGALAFLVTLALTPAAGAAGRRLGLIDLPAGTLKIHSEPTPRSGGIALFAALLAVEICAAALERPLLSRGEWLVAGLLLLVGLWDDRRPRSPRLRLLLQIGIYTLGFALGVRVAAGPAWVAFALGAIWFVLAVNAANFYDGMDGVLTLTALAAFAVWGLGHDGGQLFLLAALMLAGFLPRNWHPAKVFLGDGGSFLIGFLFYLVMIRATAADLSPVPGLLVAAVPVSDAGAASLDRLLRRRDVWSGDRDHVYDILFRLGLTPPLVALLLAFASGLCALGALLLLDAPPGARWQAAVAVYLLLTAAVMILRRRYRSG